MICPNHRPCCIRNARRISCLEADTVLSPVPMLRCVCSAQALSVKVKWEPTPRFNDLRSEAEFKRVASRDLNSKVIKAVDGNEEIQFVSAESSDNAQGDSAGSGSQGVNTHLTDDSMNED